MKARFSGPKCSQTKQRKICGVPVGPGGMRGSGRRAGSENQVEDADDDEQADQEDDPDDPAQYAQHGFPPGDADALG
jgi:hypothetical protein